MVKGISEKKENLFFLSVMALLLVIQLGVLFYYGNEKSGFHEDEIYTYYSTNKTAGLFVGDRQWMQRDQLRNDFVVLEGEGFRYNVVKQMQSWDVHPPLYYYIFHTACSFFPGLFSKWLGIGVNLAAYMLSFVLLGYAAFTAVTGSRSPSETLTRQARYLTILTCMTWGFGTAVISGVVFIRMYQWLTVFVLLVLSLHLRAVKKQDFRIHSFLLPVGITVFLGFLTQYYYIIFHFFLGAGFCLYLLRNKRIRTLLSYGAVCALSLGAALLYYPASLSHIFRGYRGTEAVGEFSDLSNTWGRLRFFFGLFDDYMMSDTLSWWLLLLLLLAVTVFYKRKRGKKENFFKEGSFVTAPVLLVLFTAVGYFFTISKTALLLGETSNRYQLPIYGIWIFLLCYCLWTLLGELLPSKAAPIAALLLAILFLAMDVVSLVKGRVFFLYQEEKAVMEFVKHNAGEHPAAVFYNEASPNNIWRLSDELMEYPEVYLASLGNQEPVRDSVLTGCDSLLLYVADYGESDALSEGAEGKASEILPQEAQRLLSENENLDHCRLVAEKGIWRLYLLWGQKSRE